MKQFDLYVNTDIDTKDTYPYFVDIQTNLLSDLGSRVVLPIAPVKSAKEYPNNLCPKIQINNQHFALLTHQITTVPSSFLEYKEGSLQLSRDQIIASIDFLVTGI